MDPDRTDPNYQVADVEATFAELRANGLGGAGSSNTSLQAEPNYGGARTPAELGGSAEFRLFFVAAPDGLCFCVGERTVRLREKEMGGLRGAHLHPAGLCSRVSRTSKIPFIWRILTFLAPACPLMSPRPD
jgi:hypothetical protein